MQLWTKEHTLTLLPAVAAMLLIAAILRKFLGKQPLKIRLIPFQILAAIVFLLEIGKQACSLHRGYNLYHLPFHLCSLFIFMLPLAAFYRGKHQQNVRLVTAAICTATTMLTLIYPNLIYSAWDITNIGTDFIAFHTVVFHNIVIFETFLLLALNLHEPEKTRSFRTLGPFMLGFCVVSATMAQLLKTNFNNFYSCNVPPLEALRLNLQGSLGYVPTQVLYVAIVTAVDILFVTGSYELYRLLHRLCNRQTSKTKV